MRNFRLGYPSLFDPGDKMAVGFKAIIPVGAFPSTLVISPSGRISGRIIGAVTVQNLTKLIEEASRRAPHR